GDIWVEDLPNETVVYDRATNRGHCLNATAAQVFRLADGQRTVAQIAAALSVGDQLDVVWLTLEELAACGLLAEPLPQGPSLTRRALITAGVGAALLPVIMTITASEALAY
ncbi:MAG: PqqD family peptide modification chaperone, partial [Armatimonadetes bacterium]|nr:PqqD family peptide modification chaperone [Armatimonadota bacterium]